jgi:hypothetical protein
MSEQAAHTEKDLATFAGAFDASAPRQGTHPQILAIGAAWGDQTLSEVVTTLAKVQLHRTCVELSSRGYEMRLARVRRPE